MKNKIQKSDVQEIFELNSIQKGLLYHFLKETDDNLYNVQLSFDIKGDFNKDVLREAIDYTQLNNEALRSVFRWEKVSKPVQIVLKNCHIDFSYHDLLQTDAKDIQRLIEEHSNSDWSERFDLTNLPFRVQIIQTNHQSFVLNITYHHILHDGWSNGVLLKEVFGHYEHLIANKKPSLYQKPNYNIIQRALRQKIDHNEQGRYWKKYLENYKASFLFLNNHVRQIHLGQTQRQLFTTSATKLKAFSSKHKVTQAAVIYAAYGLLLHKYNNSSDVVFGTTVSNRDIAIKGIEQTIGNFVNTIPLRLETSMENSLLEVVNNVHKGIINRSQYTGTAYPDIKEFLGIKATDDLYDSVIAIENYPLDEESIINHDNFNVELRNVRENTSTPLVITVFFKEELEIELMYKSNLISHEFVKSLAYNYTSILNDIIDDCSKNVGLISGKLDQVDLQLLKKFNATEFNSTNGNTVVDLFEEQAQRHPEHLALECGEEKLTFGQLSVLSNHIASYLHEVKGVRSGDLVGLMLDREKYLVPLILGVLKAGGAFVPIDPNYPANRVKSIINNSSLKVLITRAKHKDVFAASSTVLNLDEYLEDIIKFPVKPLSQKLDCKNLAYVLYTSGSTGTPKGVMIEHRSLMNYIKWAAGNYVKNEKATFPLYTSISFDLTITSIFTPLITGNKIMVYEENEFNFIEKVINREDIDIIKLTPSHLKIVNDGLDPDSISGKRTKKLIVGGEALPTQLAKDIYQKFRGKVEIYNEYGPTEATVGCMTHKFDQTETTTSVSIGHPINNTQIYLLNESLEHVPTGMIGELFISGDNLARGYVGGDEITDQHFIENPFIKGKKMYRTGDVAVRCFNGEVVFKGRKDDQVKINGHRVELGEIERHLLSHDSIKEAIVTIREEEDNTHTVAYYVASNRIETDEIKSHLSETLPQYMVPHYYMHLDQMPLNSHGKLDKKALPQPEIKIEEERVTSVNSIEEKLVRIWSDILKLDGRHISVTKSFLDLGGHSLKIVLMLNRVLKEFDVLVPINDFFTYQTVRALGIYIQSKETKKYTAIEKTASAEYYKLSSGQKRLYFLYEIDKPSIAYNGGNSILMEGDLNKEKIDNAFQKLIARHDILRTSFVTINGEPVQRISPQVDFEIEHFSATEGGVQASLKGFVRPFDLREAPLIRVGLIEISPEKHILIVDVHHIIGDGVSQQVLIKEFMNIYNEKKLPELALQFQDYAEWQQSERQKKEIAKQKEFWLNEFSGDIPAIELLTDYARPLVKSYEGNSIGFDFSKEETIKLRSVAEGEGVTMFTLLFAFYNILLSKISNQDDIVVGVPVSGRSHPDLENMVGFIINVLPLRSRFQADLAFKGFLSSVGSKVLSYFDNQAYPYEELIDALNVKRDKGRNPLFDVMFVFQNVKESALMIPGVRIEPLSETRTTSKFDISLSAFEDVDQISFRLEYSAKLFKPETIKRFVSYFRRIMLTVISDDNVRISDINVLGEAEKHELLYQFNDTRISLPQEKSVISLFEKQVKITPNKTALEFNDDQITYQELNERANQLGHYLVSRGVKEESVVGLMLERSFDMIIAMVGILKAGGTYLPLDGTHPKERVTHILNESSARLLLTEPKNVDVYKKYIDIMEMGDEQIHHMPNENLPIKEAFLNIVYIIYTSGSTGKPKGVMVSHQGLVNLITSMQQQLEIGEEEKILQFSTISFDASVEQIWMALCSGSVLVLINKQTIADNNEFNSYISEKRITYLHATPSYLESIELHKPNSLKRIIAAGEECGVQLANRLSKEYKFYNKYGLTETTVTSTLDQVTENEINKQRVTIGKPIKNTWLYILDDQLKLVPKGVKGELFISGEGLAKGYINDQKLTKEKFIDNPFVEGRKMYATGDYAKWRPDGNIEFVGRYDDLVKINGFRIGLQEIANQLSTHEDIREAVVLKRKKNGDNFLVAYYVSSKKLEPTVLRGYLKEILPDYMVPAFYISLEKMPWTSNGKLDKSTLASIEIGETINHTLPINETQKSLVEIWSDILAVEVKNIGIDTNFYDLGGNSLKLIRMTNKVEKHFNISIPLAKMFEFPTISGIASFLDKKDGTASYDIDANVESGLKQMSETVNLLNNI